MIKEFKNEIKTKYDNPTLALDAGKINNSGIISSYQLGAKKTFAVGMPVYDLDKNEIGRLSIGLWTNLDYHIEGSDMKVSAYHWRIDGYKGEQQKILTYYQVNVCNS